MTDDDDMELIRGSGNVFRDFGRSDAGLEQARVLVAARIVRSLQERALTTRDAERTTGISHAEFSRIRRAQLRRFTLDRLIAILGKLDETIEVRVNFERHGLAPSRKAPDTVEQDSERFERLSS